jgi:hypothetical protein
MNCKKHGHRTSSRAVGRTASCGLRNKFDLQVSEGRLMSNKKTAFCSVSFYTPQQVIAKFSCMKGTVISLL